MPPNPRPYVLVADPDRKTPEAVTRAASRFGLEVAAVRDGAAAHDVFVQRGLPALAIIELALARRDGFSVLRALRRLDPSRQVHAIALSAIPAMRDAAERLSAELGPLVVVARPLPEAALLRALEESSTRTAEASRQAAAPAEPPSPPARPPLEAKRLEAIAQRGLVDAAPPPAELQRIVTEVAKSFGVPIALVSLVLEDRQWFKAHVGLKGQLLAERGSPRDWSFCQHVVAGNRALVVPDARHHPVFAENPLVLDGTVVGYAGAPLTTPDGEVLGTLCIFDQRPLDLGPAELDRLIEVARRVGGEIELRAAKARLERASVRLRVAAPTGESEPQPEAYLAAALSAVETGVVLLGIDRRVLFANEAVATLFGLAHDALTNMDREALVSRLAESFADPSDAERLHIPPSGPWSLRESFDLSRPSQRVVRWVSAPIPLPGGAGQLLSFTDVTAETELARQREGLARTDALTGLPNRRGAEELLVAERARARRYEAKLSVAMVDVDEFKLVNDRHGHALGDAVLRAFAAVAKAALRTEDVAARWGGEEFLLVLPSTDRDGACQLGERLRASIEALEVRGLPRFTVSVGIAELARDEPLEEGLARADAALYRAKRLGRNRVTT